APVNIPSPSVFRKRTSPLLAFASTITSTSAVIVCLFSQNFHIHKATPKVSKLLRTVLRPHSGGEDQINHRSGILQPPKGGPPGQAGALNASVHEIYLACSHRSVTSLANPSNRV